MNIVIVDDSINNDLSEMLKRISSELPFAIKIDSYADSFTFLDFILKNTAELDGIFIRTKIGEDSGINLISNIYSKISNVPVIFVSDDPAADCQNIFLATTFFKPFGFICEPCSNHIVKKLCIQLEELKNARKSHIDIKVASRKTVSLACSSIIYIESNKRKITLHTVKEDYSLYAKLKEFRELLPSYFAMPHSSFLINCKYILSYDSKNIHMIHDHIIPISKSLKPTFFNELKNN